MLRARRHARRARGARAVRTGPGGRRRDGRRRGAADDAAVAARAGDVVRRARHQPARRRRAVLRRLRLRRRGHVAVGALEPQFFAALLAGLGLADAGLPGAARPGRLAGAARGVHRARSRPGPGTTGWHPSRAPTPASPRCWRPARSPAIRTWPPGDRWWSSTACCRPRRRRGSPGRRPTRRGRPVLRGGDARAVLADWSAERSERGARCAGRSTTPTTRRSATPCGRSWPRRSCRTPPSGTGRASCRGGVRGGGRAGPARDGGARGVRRRRGPRLPVQRRPGRGGDAGRGRRAGAGLCLVNDVCLPYFLDLATDEQRARWLPASRRGELITGDRDDRAGRRLGPAGDRHDRRPRRRRVGGQRRQDLHHQRHQRRPGDRRRQDRPDAAAPRAVSLLVLERGMPGFERGRNLDKIGLHAQDTAELSFADVRVPAANLLGEEGRASRTSSTGCRRSGSASRWPAVAGAAAALELDGRATCAPGRRSGSRSASFQNTRFRLAEVATEVDVAQAFVDACVLALNDGDAHRRGRGQGQVVVHRAAGPGRSTPACSCSAATAT